MRIKKYKRAIQKACLYIYISIYPLKTNILPPMRTALLATAILMMASLTVTTAKLTPVKDFNFTSLFICGFHTCNGLFINSVYQSTGDYWNYQYCAAMTFFNSSNSGNMFRNNSKRYDALANSVVVSHEDLYFDPKDQAKVYTDAKLTNLAFTVVNYTEFPIKHENETLTQRAAIIAVQNGDDLTVFGVTEHVFFDVDSYDIRDFLKSNGINANLNENFFFLNTVCGPPMPSTAYTLFKNHNKILGDWNVLGVYDSFKYHNWSTTTCPEFHFDGVPNHLYNMSLSYKDQSGKSVNQGPWSLWGDNANVVMYYGNYFADFNSKATLLEFVHYDNVLLHNAIVVSTDACMGFYISQRRTSISASEKEAF